MEVGALTSPPMPEETWTRRGRYLRNYDGDTVAVELSLGFGFKFESEKGFRLLGDNSPELHEAGGIEARDFAANWFAPHPDDPKWPLRVRTIEDKTEKYGRYLATIWRVRDGASLTTAMLNSGHAKVWDGKGRRPV